MKHFKPHQYKTQEGAIATPRSQNVYGPTLDPKKLPSALGMRPGSNDHLAWKSKHV